MTHRNSAELINEALETYLEADRRYRKIMVERLDQAKRGAFASDEEVEAFFAKHADSG